MRKAYLVEIKTGNPPPRGLETEEGLKAALAFAGPIERVAFDKNKRVARVELWMP